jgi:hypothetical protein
MQNPVNPEADFNPDAEPEIEAETDSEPEDPDTGREQSFTEARP